MAHPISCVEDHLIGSLAKPKSTILTFLRVLFFAGKFASFDASIALAGDVDGERGVLESITDRVGCVVNTVDLPKAGMTSYVPFLALSCHTRRRMLLQEKASIYKRQPSGTRADVNGSSSTASQEWA